MISDHVADNIVSYAGSGDCVIEIGPGTGMLTARLASHYNRVIAVELDQRLKPLHDIVKASYTNVEFVYEDFLKWHPVEASAVVGNLPYYITTPILEKTFLNIKPKVMVIMVQKELAQRMVAKPGSKTYGALSVFVQSFTKPFALFNVKPTCFYPAPKVESSVLKLEGNYNPDIDAVLLEKLVKKAFQQRRKMLKNVIGEETILLETAKEAHIDVSLRPEQITVEQFNYWASLLKGQNIV